MNKEDKYIAKFLKTTLTGKDHSDVIELLQLSLGALHSKILALDERSLTQEFYDKNHLEFMAAFDSLKVRSPKSKLVKTIQKKCVREVSGRNKKFKRVIVPEDSKHHEPSIKKPTERKKKSKRVTAERSIPLVRKFKRFEIPVSRKKFYKSSFDVEIKGIPYKVKCKGSRRQMDEVKNDTNLSVRSIKIRKYEHAVTVKDNVKKDLIAAMSEAMSRHTN